MYRGSDYVAGASLTLVTPQDIQLDIQMSQKHRGQWQTHPGRYFYGQKEVQRFYGIMGWDPKTNMQSQKATKAARWATTENFEEELTQYDNLAFPVILFFNSTLIASSFGESSMVARSTSPRIGKSNWLATSSRVTVSSPQEKKNVWVVAHHQRTK